MWRESIRSKVRSCVFTVLRGPVCCRERGAPSAPRSHPFIVFPFAQSRQRLLFFFLRPASTFCYISRPVWRERERESIRFPTSHCLTQLERNIFTGTPDMTGTRWPISELCFPLSLCWMTIFIELLLLALAMASTTATHLTPNMILLQRQVFWCASH